MQHFILSEMADIECLNAHGNNGLRKCIELLGLYEGFIDEGGNADDGDGFERFYIDNANRRKWHYVNIGTRIIYGQLKDSYEGIGGHKYSIYKTTIRRYGYTKRGHRVTVFEGSYVVLRISVNLIRESDLMKMIYRKYIHNIEVENFLTFQETCILRYLATGDGIRQRYYGDEVNGEIIRLLEEG